MYTLYPQRQSLSPYYYYDDDDHLNDYYRALAAQQARQRQEALYKAQLQEARYSAQLEEARRRRAYKEQLARDLEEDRRRRVIYPTLMRGFSLQNDAPYSSFMRRGQGDSEDFIHQHSAARVSQRRSPSMAGSPSPVREESPVPEAREPPKQRTPSPLEHRTPPPELVHLRPLSPKQTTPLSSPSLKQNRDEAARKIQYFFRAQLPRLKSFNAISAIARQFETLTSQFPFPPTLDFAELATTPELLYTQRNAPLHGHENALVKFMSKLDEVESHGDEGVRKARKQLVNRIERELAVLDEKKMEAWKAFKTVLSTLATFPASSPSSEDANVDAAVDTPVLEDISMTETVADSRDPMEYDSGYCSSEAEDEAKEKQAVEDELVISVS